MGCFVVFILKNKKKNEIDNVIDDIRSVARILMGGPDERGEKLLKASGFFLMVPDPTMISTSIGLTMIATGKLLMKRKKKGLKDLLEEHLIDIRYTGELVRDLL
ncbi:MAG: hypothetical protein J7L82_00515 [Staphylothermus sp.]|nr:hypothetical protein [Staphylothermus sp.]